MSMRTIKLCAISTQRPTTLLEAIRRSAIEIERTDRIPRPVPTERATSAPA
jgi:hypothetical protein